jgi:hypothetical protein
MIVRRSGCRLDPGSGEQRGQGVKIGPALLFAMARLRRSRTTADASPTKSEMGEGVVEHHVNLVLARNHDKSVP